MISAGVFLAPALGKMRCFRLARSSASQKQQLRRSRSCRVIEFSNLQRVELPAASLTPSAERKPSSSVMTSWSAKSSNPQIGDGQQPRHHGGDKPPVGDLHAAAEPISCCCSSKTHGKVFCFDFFVVEKILTKRPFLLKSEFKQQNECRFFSAHAKFRLACSVIYRLTVSVSAGTSTEC